MIDLFCLSLLFLWVAMNSYILRTYDMAGYAVDTKNKKSEERTDPSLMDVCNIYFEWV